MDKKESFSAHINSGYASKGDSIILGGAMLDGAPLGGDALVRIPLKTMNRHGLIAGATGTGKTKTLQVISEHLSEKGVPVLLMDVKGDLSGISKPGEEKPFIMERMTKIGVPYETRGYPVELMSISQQPGVRMRATISEFGPVLLSRILDLNDTQGGVLAVIFKYCDDHKMPLLDLKDLKKVVQFATDEGKTEIEREYGKLSAMSTGVILRKLLELEQQDADLFFGEMSFEIRDLMRRDSGGKGYINIIRLTDIQDRPKLFSTFMLCLLAEVYNEMPERGDLDKPELVIFIDEAHLIFKEAGKTLLSQIETIVKLIRSKGVGVFFVTQNPMDVPNEVLAQLGLKVQHALRAFTAIDRQAIKLTAENFPLSDWYKTDEVLTSLGTGEALVTVLNEKGIPTPLAVTMIRAPQSRMDILSPEEIEAINRSSQLVSRYNQDIDRESAYEMLTDKIDSAGKKAVEEAERRQEEKSRRSSGTTRGRSGVNPVVKVLTSATFIRGVLGIMRKVIK